jgi:hypothetical protein
VAVGPALDRRTLVAGDERDVDGVLHRCSLGERLGPGGRT